MALGLAHAYSRAKVKFTVNKVDNMTMQAIALLDVLDKDFNTFFPAWQAGKSGAACGGGLPGCDGPGNWLSGVLESLATGFSGPRPPPLEGVRKSPRAGIRAGRPTLLAS